MKTTQCFIFANMNIIDVLADYEDKPGASQE